MRTRTRGRCSAKLETHGKLDDCVLDTVQSLHAENVAPGANEDTKVAWRELFITKDWATGAARALTSDRDDGRVRGHEANGEEQEVEDDEGDCESVLVRHRGQKDVHRTARPTLRRHVTGHMTSDRTNQVMR